MRIGGIERSLIALLEYIDCSRYEVDLFLFIHDGEFMSMIPEKINLLPEIKRYNSLLITVRENLKRGYFDILAAKLMAAFKARRFCRKNGITGPNMVYFDYLHRYVGRLLPKINPAKEYDLAVSFINPHHICASKVRSKKKIAWIHTDYSFFRFDTAEVMRVWSKYNHIASISESCTTAFATQFPALANKIVLIENVLSPTFILRQALSDDVSRELDLQTDTISICSVGRFTEAKNFDNVPAICKIIVDNGLNIKWFLVGYGGEEALIRAKIAETGMSDHVIIIGKRSNPYPYINACTLYVQPSRYEGKSVTVREAQILCKPVVITRYATSASQLRDGYDGIIVPTDNEGCAQGIMAMINDPALQNRLIENCRNSDFSNLSEVEKFCKLIEND